MTARSMEIRSLSTCGEALIARGRKITKAPFPATPSRSPSPMIGLQLHRQALDAKPAQFRPQRKGHNRSKRAACLVTERGLTDSRSRCCVRLRDSNSPIGKVGILEALLEETTCFLGRWLTINRGAREVRTTRHLDRRVVRTAVTALREAVLILSLVIAVVLATNRS